MNPLRAAAVAAVLAAARRLGLVVVGRRGDGKFEAADDRPRAPRCLNPYGAMSYGGSQPTAHGCATCDGGGAPCIKAPTREAEPPAYVDMFKTLGIDL